MKYLLKGKKGCKTFNDVFVLTNNFQGNTKWEQELGNIGDDEWKMYNIVINSLKEVKLRDFQYKITNRILLTRSFLHRINKTDDNLYQILSTTDGNYTTSFLYSVLMLDDFGAFYKNGC